MVLSCYRAASQRQLPVWRSIHFVPANVPRFIDKATSLDADALQIDLEDSVPPAEKSAARAQLNATVQKLKRDGVDLIVRVNRPLSLAVRDIEAAVQADVAALTLPKVDGASHIRLLDELISEREMAQGLALGHTRLIVVIETPEAFERMRAIAEASPRVVAMMLGSEDFSLACCSRPSDEVMLMPKQQMIIAARAAGVLPFGYIGTIANFRDTDAFAAMVARSRDFGFEAGTSIHPSQIPVLNAVFGPDAEHIAYAQRVVAAYDEALQAGRGACELDGTMIDVPVVERARRLLHKAAALQNRSPHPA